MGGVSDRQKIQKAVAANGAEAAAARAADEAEQGLAQLIGQAVALHLAQLLQHGLPQLLSGLPLQPGCVLCTADAKRAQDAWLAAAQEAMAAAQEAPPRPAAGIRPSVTVTPVDVGGGQQVPLPVCFGHFQVGPEVRQVGLVDPGGNPILAHGGA